MERSLKKRYLIKLLSNIIHGFINIILVAIVPKALGPVAFGHFSYLQQFFSQVIAFLDAGTSTAFFTKLSARNGRKELLTFYFILSLALICVLFCILYLMDTFDYLGFFLPSIPSEYIVYGALFGIFTWVTQVFIKISDAFAITVSVEIVKILHKLATLLLLLYIINFLPFDLHIYFYFQFISLLSFLMIVFILFKKKSIITNQFFNLKIKYQDIMREFYIYSSPLFVFNVAAIFIGLFDIWLLQTVSGSIETGFYGLAYSIAAMSFLFTGAMTPIITREFSKSFAENDYENLRKLFKRYIPMLYAITAYFSVFIAFQAENLLKIFVDETFKDALFAIIIMAFYPIHQTYGQLSGSLFFANGTTGLYRNIGLISSFIGLFFSYLFIYHFKLGALGFGVKMILAQVIGVNIQLYFNAKFLNIKMFSFVIHQIYIVVLFSLLAYFSSSFVYSDTITLNFLFTGFIYTLLIIIFVFFFPRIIALNKSEVIEYIVRWRSS